MASLNLNGTHVGYERKGYGRGLILGLTMAESMLLLVFCLLLVAGAILAKTQDELRQARATIENKEAIIADLNERIGRLNQDRDSLLAQIATLMKSTGRDLPQEDWTKLVLAKNAADRIEAAGLSLEDAVVLVEVTKAARDNSVTPEDFTKLLAAEARANAAEQRAMMEAERAKSLAERAEAEEQKRLETERQLAASSGGKPHEWPPIIDLSEAKGYSFEIGSAELKPDFRDKLSGSIAGQIASIVAKYGVDVVEVIGHTDEQGLSRESNIDRVIRRVLAGEEAVSVMHPGDNAGLGLARALSVAMVLREIPELQRVDILPLSGAQLILPDDRMTDGAQSGDAPARRRIEIRVRKSKRQLEAEANEGT